ncbi:rhodanese-like domain-containing protein [Pseudalkalibacillus caeni]|uniref:Rhodanese-like domain-containing protein n=1 Tax=Exobacillus caeni TaxID=2574798 RepID=A0A5R9F7N2_9BACL|nr:rhodanese-like domain-containing protein [Pseudalkalibacillus caeni]TLS39041.1 rhodanese-like domain-containing protein [Pseudalkalibacillus caeni]
MSEEVKVITPKEVENLLDEGKTISLIDVREDEEVAEGTIPGAKHIRLGTIPERLEEINKNEEHIIVCRSGRRSEHACDYLQEQGFNVRNMVGGMMKWEGDVK